ncbi:MAG: ATP-binding cassette domain-containing protein [Bdellovibrionota bacterium]
MVKLEEVSKSYNVQGRGQVRVLEQINFELKNGEFAYVVGGTGAGKSTMFRLIATEESPTMGGVSLFGYRLAKVSSSTLRAIRQSIGYVPQDIRLISDLSVYDNIALAISLGGRRVISMECKQRIADILERLGLAAKKDQMAKTLSGGESQRVAVARALARGPDLVIADEPTGAQDREFAWSLMDLFLKSNLIKKSAVLIATHDRDIVRRVRRRCVTLRSGKIISEELQPCMY